jgi:hypothetical protein
LDSPLLSFGILLSSPFLLYSQKRFKKKRKKKESASFQETVVSFMTIFVAYQTINLSDLLGGVSLATSTT